MPVSRRIPALVLAASVAACADRASDPPTDQVHAEIVRPTPGSTNAPELVSTDILAIHPLHGAVAHGHATEAPLAVTDPGAIHLGTFTDGSDLASPPAVANDANGAAPGDWMTDATKQG